MLFLTKTAKKNIRSNEIHARIRIARSMYYALNRSKSSVENMNTFCNECKQTH